METLKILIIEDDIKACNRFLECAENQEDMLIVSTTNNVTTALQEIQDYLPEVLILDLELQQGGGSGVELLYKLKQMDLDNFPYILVTTNSTSITTHEVLREYGADFIMSKHQSDYSEESVLDFLRIMKTGIKRKSASHASNPSTTETPDLRSRRIKKRIETELNYLGINPKLLGYRYLADAIYIQSEKPTQYLANIIANKYGKSNASVERAMQTAINHAWNKTDYNELLKHYTAKISAKRGTPSITEFVSYYAMKINADYL